MTAENESTVNRDPRSDLGRKPEVGAGSSPYKDEPDMRDVVEGPVGDASIVDPSRLRKDESDDDDRDKAPAEA